MGDQDDVRVTSRYARLLASVGIPLRESSVGGVRTITVVARDLHRVAGSRVPVSLWLYSHTNGGRAVDTVADDADAGPRVERLFTLHAAIEVAMMQGGRVGKRVLEYFIDCEASLRRVDRDLADAMARAALGGLDPPGGGPGVLELLFGDGGAPHAHRSGKERLH